jgi:hypothetical protein
MVAQARAGLIVVLTSTASQPSLPGGAGALENVAKHSKANQATVRLERGPDYVSPVIKDWGLGFQDVPEGAERGLGLVSMGERVRLVNVKAGDVGTRGRGRATCIPWLRRRAFQRIATPNTDYNLCLAEQTACYPRSWK